MVFILKCYTKNTQILKGVIHDNKKIVGSRMSKIVEHNGEFIFAGIVPNDKTLDVKGQTNLRCIKYCKIAFEEANTDKENILRADLSKRYR